MKRSAGRDAGEVEVPRLVGLAVREARNAGHEAGVVMVAADVDGPPLGSALRGPASGSSPLSAGRREAGWLAGRTW